MRSLKAALEAYLARRDGQESPAGEWHDSLWRPAPAELRPCCARIVGHCVWEDALRRHCRSLRHVAALHGVDESELRRALRRQAAVGGPYYFVAARQEGPRLVVVGSNVELRLGHKVVGVGTGAKAFESAVGAEAAAHGHGVRDGVILRVEVTGGRLGPTGLSFDQARPVEVIRNFGEKVRPRLGPA